MLPPPSEYAEAVLDLVERIPPGRVMSYGMIAEYLRERTGRGSPRVVGTVLARYGSGVAWHRVVSGAGRLPPGHEVEARTRLAGEGVPFQGEHVLMEQARWWPDDD
jgi:alkylated DNA nucleotide flippase Atl1